MADDVKAPWEIHMEETIEDFSKKYREKFTRGVKEHGGNLHRKPALNVSSWALEEVLDLVSYLSVIEGHLKTIRDITDRALNSPISNPHQLEHNYQETVQQISNIIHIGNPEGEVQEGD